VVVFFDTSALLKRYRQETGTDTVEKIFDRASDITLSQTTRCEAVSALHFHSIRGGMTKAQCEQAQGNIAIDFEDFRIIPLDGSLEQIVQKVAEKHGHKALDNIQLASAIVAKPRLFVTSDKKLAKLAQLEKLRVKLV
jgi:predicted nucleic acid-binding protein